MKKFFTLLAICLSGFIAHSQSLVISQIYGGGGNTSATYNVDFIELFNPTGAAISTNGLSVQYSSATGTAWSKFDLPAASIASGKYFLIQTTAAGANGVALPTPDASTTTINMSGTAGKVALVNGVVALSGAAACSGVTVIDVVGFGTATTSCAESSVFLTAGITTAQSIQRKSNGCTETNNNLNDFQLATVTPRNNVTAANPCGAPSALISASPNISNLTTTLGVASTVVSFNLSGSTLTPAVGDINAQASAGLEISLNAGGPFTSSINVPYTGSTLAATPVYVRITTSAPQGAIAGTITNSGGTASNAVVTVSGGVYQNYYNTKSNSGLNNVGTWSTTTNGAGASPANFTDAYQYFNIINATNATYTGVWDVTSAGNSSVVVVGDGINPLTFIVKPGVDSVTSATRIDVNNNATLQIENNRRPFINNLAIGSTVNYAQNGTTTADTIRIAALTYYNLTLTNGLKFLSGNTTTVRGNFTANNVASFNGNAVSPFSTINAFGDVNFTATTFDIGTAGEAGRLTLAMNGNNGSQEINGNGGEFRLFRLQRDTTSSSSSINVGPSTTIILGNPSGGGLRLNQGAATTTVLELGDNILKFNGGAVSTTTSNGKIAVSGNLGQIEINKNVGTTNAGILRFMPGSAVKNFIVNFDPAQTKDSITLANDLEITGILTLTKGKLVVTTGSKLTLNSTGSISGGSTASFIDGKIQFNFSASTGSVVAHVGKGVKYAPVTIAQPTAAANVYTVEYFFSSYGNFTINPITLFAYPSYMVSAYEYWNIDQLTPYTANLTFNYTDANSIIVNPLGVRIAQFGGILWSDLGGTPNPANTASLGSVAVTGVNNFGPFTFSALNGTVIPVKLEYIRGQKSGAQNLINWKLTCLSTRITMEVERGSNSRQFTSIQTIQATQNRCALPFDFNDAAPLNGSNFYRIKITDIDGQVSYSPVVAISNGKRNVEIAGLYPSVVYQTTYLSVAAAKATTIETNIIDMSGRIVKSFRQAIPAGSSMVPVPCENLASGMYQLILSSDGLSNETIRFIKR